MASAAQLKRLRKKYKLGEYAPKKRARKVQRSSKATGNPITRKAPKRRPKQFNWRMLNPWTV